MLYNILHPGSDSRFFQRHKSILFRETISLLCVLSIHILFAQELYHRINLVLPLFQAETLLSKTSWSGALEGMQYFATLTPHSKLGGKGALDPLEEILWLSQETIEDRESSGPLPPAKAFVKSPRAGPGVEERDAGSER